MFSFDPVIMIASTKGISNTVRFYIFTFMQKETNHFRKHTLLFIYITNRTITQHSLQLGLHNIEKKTNITIFLFSTIYIAISNTINVYTDTC